MTTTNEPPEWWDARYRITAENINKPLRDEPDVGKWYENTRNYWHETHVGRAYGLMSRVGIPEDTCKHLCALTNTAVVEGKAVVSIEVFWGEQFTSFWPHIEQQLRWAIHETADDRRVTPVLPIYHWVWQTMPGWLSNQVTITAAAFCVPILPMNWPTP